MLGAKARDVLNRLADECIPTLVVTDLRDLSEVLPTLSVSADEALNDRLKRHEDMVVDNLGGGKCGRKSKLD
jgi:hypothetical protein